MSGKKKIPRAMVLGPRLNIGTVFGGQVVSVVEIADISPAPVVLRSVLGLALKKKMHRSFARDDSSNYAANFQGTTLAVPANERLFIRVSHLPVLLRVFEMKFHWQFPTSTAEAPNPAELTDDGAGIGVVAAGQRRMWPLP